jgi:hypothetical protein
MSSQIIHLKARADSLDRSRIPAMETIRVLAAALGRCSWAGLGQALVSYGNGVLVRFGGLPMVTSRECKERAAECREMAECEPNAHVRAVLNDMARGWNRLALQAAQFTNQAQLGFSFATVSHELENVRRE